jgi:site-specific recombinase XerD
MPKRPASEIIVHDQSRKVPQPRGKDQKIDRELQAELRIAQALAAGADGTLENISQDHFEAEFKAMALNSKIAAAADLDCYVDWCLAEQRAAFPADPVTLVRYIEAKVKAKAKPATIVRRISSIAKAHHMLGLEPEGPRNRMVRQTLVAINKKKNQRQAAAIRVGENRTGTSSPITIQALLECCDSTLRGLRDAALLSVGYYGGLRVSELTAATVEDLEVDVDGTGTLTVPFSKTEQEGEGAEVWMPADAVRRLRAWLEAAKIEEGVMFRRIHVTRKKAKDAIAPQAWDSIPGHTRHYQERLEGQAATQAITVYTVGPNPLTTQGVNAIYKRLVERAWLDGLIEVGKDSIDKTLKAISSHSLRVGLTHDLIALGADGVAITNAMRWTSPGTILRYGKKLRAKSSATARFLGGETE